MLDDNLIDNMVGQKTKSSGSESAFWKHQQPREKYRGHQVMLFAW
jgi:hypothetical protein